jgi:hypothetical protein
MDEHAAIQDLHLQHLRLATENLLDLHFPRFGKHLQRLCLRQNSLTSPLPAEAFAGLEALEELDMYDNKLGHRVHDEELAGCPNLQYVASLIESRTFAYPFLLIMLDRSTSPTTTSSISHHSHRKKIYILSTLFKTKSRKSNLDSWIGRPIH